MCEAHNGAFSTKGSHPPTASVSTLDPPAPGGRPSQKWFLGLCRHWDPNPASTTSSEEPKGSPPFSFPPKGRKAMRCCAGPRSVHPQEASPIPGAEEPCLLPP